MSEYSARKNAFTADGGPHKAARILAAADGLRRIGEFESADMLTAYAERLKADEGAVPVAVRYFDGKNFDGSQHYAVYSLDRHQPNHGAEPLFLHPPAQATSEAIEDAAGEPINHCNVCGQPVRYGERHSRCGEAVMAAVKAAQAAQVDQVGELLAIIHGDGGHYQAEHGLQKAAKDAQEKVIQMMTKIATAEPVVQDGELPGMWSNSDFTGGDPDERSHAERNVPTAEPALASPATSPARGDGGER